MLWAAWAAAAAAWEAVVASGARYEDVPLAALSTLTSAEADGWADLPPAVRLLNGRRVAVRGFALAPDKGKSSTAGTAPDPAFRVVDNPTASRGGGPYLPAERVDC